jgi:ribonuclease T1
LATDSVKKPADRPRKGRRLEILGGFRYHLGLGFQGYPVVFTGQVTAGQAFKKLALAVTTAAGLMASAPGSAWARSEASGGSAVQATVDLSTLPPQARQTHQRILAGGPFPYGKDGTVFGNRERLLPLHPRGYYREYTVKTPGASNRGARRIVCGGLRPTAPEACYYTADHYASFKRIVQ